MQIIICHSLLCPCFFFYVCIYLLKGFFTHEGWCLSFLSRYPRDLCRLGHRSFVRSNNTRLWHIVNVNERRTPTPIVALRRSGKVLRNTYLYSRDLVYCMGSFLCGLTECCIWHTMPLATGKWLLTVFIFLLTKYGTPMLYSRVKSWLRVMTQDKETLSQVSEQPVMTGWMNGAHAL